jgi:Cof subfamily protein (haloacid dehalogenase superfamily)
LLLNNRFKLLVTDIDGTLADREGNISDTDLQAVRTIHSQGVNFSLCTGRAASGCRKVLDRLAIDGWHIFFDGALITNSQLTRDIYNQPIEPELVNKVRKLAQGNDLVIEFFPREGFFIESYHPFSLSHGCLLDLRPNVTDLKQVSDKQKILLICLVITTADVNKVLDWCEPLKPYLNFTATNHPGYPEIRFINVSAKTVSKGEALKALMVYLGLQKEAVVAVGDGANDIPLLLNSGLAVAMENAPGELKLTADYITDDVDHNGLATVIRRFFD